MMTEPARKFEIKINVFQITLVLIVLKLFDAINWSWWWVFSPIWIFYVAAVFLAVLFGVLAAINEWNDNNVR